MGLFDGLSTGMRGLHAAQTAIDVTGQNISNANTEGYSRKKIEQQAAAISHDMFGQIGIGVEVTGINRVRDAFLDRQTWEMLGDKGMLAEMDVAYTRLESILREPSDDGLAAKMNEFWASWQDLANNPADLAARESVKASTSVLTDVFHSVYKQIEDYGLSMNNPLVQKVETVNSLTGQIQALNEKISGMEARPGEHANDTRDERDLMVRKLSQLVDIQTVEDPNGRMIITSGGNLLVGPTSSMKLETYGVERVLADGTKSSELKLRFTDSGKVFAPRSGEMKGIMDARSNVLNDYLMQLNSLAKSLVTEVNAVHLQGYNLNRNTAVNFFDPTKVKANDITLTDSILADAANISAAENGKIAVVSTFNPAGGIPAVTAPDLDLKAVNILYRDLVSGSVQIKLSDGTILAEGAGKDYVVDYEKGVVTFLNYARYAAGDTVSVNLSYYTTGYSGNGNGQNALLIGQLRNKKSMAPGADGEPTQSISSFYGAVVGRLGIEKNQNTSRLETKEYLIAQMDSEQAAIAGVSLDEEMANMIKYETSYQASAKYIQTISSMIDVLMAI